MEKLSIIVPAYNESKNLYSCINFLISSLNKCELEYEIIIVDDGSTDGTSQIADEIGKKNQFVTVIHHDKNKMIGAAIISGIYKAKYDNIIVSPVDSPLSCEQIKKYILKSKEADIVCGYRTKREGYNFLMKILSKIYRLMLEIIFGLHLKDYTWICLYKKRIFETVKPVFTGISFFPEVLVKSHMFGFIIKEIESPMQRRIFGKATVSKPSKILGLFIETINLAIQIHKNKIFTGFLVLIFLISLFLRLIIINFGLPSKNFTLTTYNPDEPLSFQIIEKWRPTHTKNLDFHPRRVFLWGGFHLYPLAASIGIGKLFGFIKFGNREFYTNNLQEADKLYLVGRFLMILFASGTVLVLFLILKNSYNSNLALLGTFLLSIIPAHVVNSIYVRPDIMMLFFGCLAIYFSLKIVEKKEFKFYVLSCIAVGFATGTKLSGGVFGILPTVAHFLSDGEVKKKFLDIKLYLIPVFCLIGFCVSSPYVVLDFNKTEDSFWNYFKINFSLAKGEMDPGHSIFLGKGTVGYLKSYLPYGYGRWFTYGSFLGLIVIVFMNISFKVNKYDMLYIVSGLIVLTVISLPKNQTVWYTIPFIPFLIIYFVRGFDLLLEFFKQKKFLKTVVYLVMLAILAQTVIYSISYIKLFYQKNVREEASEWIEKNIPKGSKIGIARSYFWTPGVLRQYNPPYKIFHGRDPVNSPAAGGLQGVEKILDEIDYLVLTEYEYRYCQYPELEKYYPNQKDVYEKIFLSDKFDKIVEFDKEAEFLGIKFKKKYVSTDWLIPNPKIIIFKKRV